jgi:MFS family permease
VSQEANVLGHQAERRAATLIYTASFSYMITLGMVQILVPLYALHLGYDLAELGIIVASQAIFGLMLRLFAGAIADQFGERWVLSFSFGAMVAGAAVFSMTGAFWGLILAQTFVGFSRATYWTAVQSYASRINPERAGALLGKMSSSGNVGQLIGTFAVGLLAGGVGYSFSWWTVVVLGALGLAGSLGLPVLPRKQARRGFIQALAPIPGLARSKGMGMGGMAAFGASMSVAIPAILVIPYLREIDYSETLVGSARTATAVAAVIVGVSFGRFIDRFGAKNLFVAAYSIQGLTLFAIPLVGDPLWAMAPIMFAYGVWQGTMGILYPMTAAAHSSPEQRGMAMGYVGLYWGVAQLVVPGAFGFIAAAVGLSASFWIAGAIFLAAGLALPVVYPYLTKPHPASAETADAVDF